MTTVKPWPPPPDRESIQELVRAADTEGLLAEGAPVDEYEPEEEAILAAIQHLPTAELLVTTTLPLIEAVWRKSFVLDDKSMAERLPALLGLAEQIERFFGPEARPQVRQESFYNPWN
jgi:hypothetical protein